jgi:hypothetical protein
MGDVARVQGRRHAENRDHHEQATESQRGAVAQQPAPREPVGTGSAGGPRRAPKGSAPRRPEEELTGHALATPGSYFLNCQVLQSFM